MAHVLVVCATTQLGVPSNYDFGMYASPTSTGQGHLSSPMPPMYKCIVPVLHTVAGFPHSFSSDSETKLADSALSAKAYFFSIVSKKKVTMHIFEKIPIVEISKTN